MARRKNVAVVNENIDKDRIKWGKVSSYMLWGLVGQFFIALILGWLSGDTSYSKISDNFVTGFLQNYNYILGTAFLIPVIGYIYSRLKRKLSTRIVSDSQIMTYGFIGVIACIVAITAVCTIIYPINSGTYYGLNSAFTVSIFVSTFIVLILESVLYAVLYVPELIKNKGEILKVIKRYLPVILLVMFIIWTFISCMLAPEAADDVIGAQVAEKMGAEPDEVLSKTLNGCYNLKDGFWAFLMYGSVMLGAMLLGKEKDDLKKKIIIGFVISISVLSLITLCITANSNKIEKQYIAEYENYVQIVGEDKMEYTKEDFINAAKYEAQDTYSRWYIFPQRGLFRNSNHFAYVLCMAVIAAAVLAVIEKNILYKLLYILAFSIMTAMLILNDTFGGYLGVAVALIAMLIYFAIPKKSANVEVKENGLWINHLIAFMVLVAIFGTLTFTIKDSKGNPMAISNIKMFAKDIGIFGGYMINTENATSVDISEIDASVKNAGSLRGQTWIKVWELVKQRPMFGYGLECLLFQFNGQFGVGEGRTHNLLLQLLGTIGIPGTIMYFATLAIVFFRLLSNWKTWTDVEKITVFVGISYMVTALTGNSTYYTSPYFMMFLGFVVLTQWKKKEQKID